MLEENKTTRRFELGKRHGIDDKANQINSDMYWFVYTRYEEKDSEYVAGYRDGYHGVTKK